MNGTIKVAALAALLVSAAAFGADPSTDKADTSTDKQENALPDFSTLDANRDGGISKDEAREQSWVASRFGELDADKNGKLNSDEYKKAVDMMKPPNP
jgi:Ca2+-binding EF-hand superfamily protein